MRKFINCRECALINLEVLLNLLYNGDVWKGKCNAGVTVLPFFLGRIWSISNLNKLRWLVNFFFTPTQIQLDLPHITMKSSVCRWTGRRSRKRTSNSTATASRIDTMALGRTTLPRKKVALCTLLPDCIDVDDIDSEFDQIFPHPHLPSVMVLTTLV